MEDNDINNREFFDTIRVCKNEVTGIEDKELKDLLDSNVDLFEYCKKFREKFGSKSDYLEIIENAKIALGAKDKDDDAREYLDNYIKVLEEITDTLENSHDSKLRFIDSLTREKGVALSFDNFYTLRAISNDDLVFKENGKTIMLEGIAQSDKHNTFAINGNMSDVGAIFVKDKKYEYSFVTSPKEEVKVIKRIIKEKDSYDVAMLPSLNALDLKTRDFGKLLYDNKNLLNYALLKDECDMIKDREIYKHVRNSEISMLDFYKLLPDFSSMNTYVRLFDIIITVLEMCPEDKREN